MPFCKEIPTEVLLQEIGFIPFVSVGGFFDQIVYLNGLDL